MHLRGEFVRDHVTYLDATVADEGEISGSSTVSGKDEVTATKIIAAKKPPAWQVTTQQGAKATLAVSPADGMMKVDIDQLGDGKGWQVYLFGPNAAVTAKGRYRVSFRARAAEPRGMVVKVSQGQPPWESVGLFKEVRLTEAWQNFRIDFEASLDEENARLGFNLGSHNATVEIADVLFQPSSAAQ